MDRFLLICWTSLDKRRGMVSGRRGRYLVDRGMLPQRQIPEAAADLVSALAHCDEREERKRVAIRWQTRPPVCAATDCPCPPPPPPPRSLPCTTTDWVILRRVQTKVPGSPRPLSNSLASSASQRHAHRRPAAVSHAAAASHCRRNALLQNQAKFFRQKAAQGYLRPTVTIANGPPGGRSCCLPTSLSFGSSGSWGNWRVIRPWSGILKCVSLKVFMAYESPSFCSVSTPWELGQIPFSPSPRDAQLSSVFPTSPFF